MPPIRGIRDWGKRLGSRYARIRDPGIAITTYDTDLLGTICFTMYFVLLSLTTVSAVL